MEFSSGIDSYRFLLPKSTFLKFMRKIELNTKLRAVSRNKAVKAYADDKFKGQKPLIMPIGKEFKIRYVSFKRGITSLTNSMIVVENSNKLNDLCKKRKKPYGYYVMVVFAGLYQPSREVFKQTYKILSKFLRRFKPFEFDLASDIKSDTQAQKSGLKIGLSGLERILSVTKRRFTLTNAMKDFSGLVRFVFMTNTKNRRNIIGKR
ncbi:MAG: hypothetical protein LUC34_00850 [Campylobacter sp.]|nr:hypothetical protein [Campylobacter sp.]